MAHILKTKQPKRQLFSILLGFRWGFGVWSSGLMIQGVGGWGLRIWEFFGF